MIIQGGKTVYGASIGVLMLESRFPRIPGDLGHAATFPFPVLYRVVRGASPDLAVRGGAEGLLGPFIEAAQALVADGADALTTSCGFLSLFQAELAAAMDAPVAASSLMQVAMVERLLPPGRRAGVLTISASALTPRHLQAAGAAPDTPVGSTEGGRCLTRAMLEDAPSLDVDAARADVVDAATALARAHPEVGAIVLECTNMTPFAADARAATALPVFSMVDFVCWLHAGVTPRRFPTPA